MSREKPETGTEAMLYEEAERATKRNRKLLEAFEAMREALQAIDDRLMLALDDNSVQMSAGLIQLLEQNVNEARAALALADKVSK